jgi:hypothetical protein
VTPAEVRDQVRASRLAQGKPPTITDELLLTQLAAELLKGEEAEAA